MPGSLKGYAANAKGLHRAKALGRAEGLHNAKGLRRVHVPPSLESCCTHTLRGEPLGINGGQILQYVIVKRVHLHPCPRRTAYGIIIGFKSGLEFDQELEWGGTRLGIRVIEI